MTYKQALAYIHALERFGVRPGLACMRALMQKLGNPQDALRFVHVAGTNGKGSTATMLANICRAAGLRTGLYTSPYVIDFSERIQINASPIPPQALVQQVQAVRAAAEELQAQGITVTEFEAVTAAAFCYYRQENCDVVVLETGLGGRLDATNIINTPLCSVLTPISLDHVNVLGDTLAQIAAEKCGIIKPGGRTVSAMGQAPAALEGIRKTAAAKNNTLQIADENALQITQESLAGTAFTYKNRPYQIRLLGRHMAQNAALAITAAEVLTSVLPLSQEAVRAGLAATVMPARMEILRKEPCVILDGGHNAACANALANVLRTHLAGKKVFAVCAMMADKDNAGYLAPLAPYLTHLTCTQVALPRALDATALCRVAQVAGIPCDAQAQPKAALQQALSMAGKADVVLVCGSFYLAAALREPAGAQ